MARFSVQIPDTLDTWLTRQAAKNQRSKSAEVVYILEQCWRRSARTISIMTGYGLPCDHDRHYFKLVTPMENDECNCRKIRW